MHPAGVEPATFWFVVRHSIQLRYGCKILNLVQSGRRDSNPRPPPWQGDVLPLNYFRKIDMPTRGFEPPTPCLQDRCSANWAKSALSLINAIYLLLWNIALICAMSRDRLELSTLWLKVRCSTNWANGSKYNGGYRARTCDLLLVRQMLSQLS